MKCLHTSSFFAIFICTFSTCAFGQTATVTGPAGGAIEAGQTAVFTCVVTGDDTPQYIWNDLNPAQQIFVGGSPFFANIPKYSNFESSPPGDIMSITDVAVEDEGQYNCAVSVATSDPFDFKVEVGSTLTPTFPTDPLRAGTEYSAVCEVVGSRPQLDITWTVNDMALDETPVVTNPNNTDPDLSDTRSEVTFTATPAMNGQDLKCATSGNVVTSLNRETTTQLNVEYPPTNETATIVVVTTKEENNKLRLTCQISAVVDGVEPAHPAINNFTIYAGSEPIHSSTTEDSASVDIPENVTDFKCSAGNNLGTIESEVLSYDPGLGGLSTGAIVGIVIGVLLLIALVVVLVVFLVKKKDSGAKVSTTSTTNNSPPPKTMALQEQKPTNGNSEKVAPPTAAPRQSSVPHRNDNPGGAVYAEVQKGGRGYDQPDHTHPPQADSEMNYATLDLSEEAGHTERQVPQNKDNVVVYSSILV